MAHRPSARPLPRPVAFVLPGGASLGAVQVGMLTALVRAGIRPDLLVATSVGALNAAMFAGDPTPGGVERLAELWRRAPRRQIFPFQPLALARAVRRADGHLLPNDGLLSWIRAHLRFPRLEDAAIPLHVLALDADTGEPVLLSRGDAAVILLASCALPGVFPPVELDGRRLVDGGAACNHRLLVDAGLTCATFFELPTVGRPAHGTTSLRARLWRALDQRFGRPAMAPSPDGAGWSEGGPLHVHILEAPSTETVNPFSFRHSHRLIVEAEGLTTAWLARNLPRRTNPLTS